jgi:hypothetical protein
VAKSKINFAPTGIRALDSSACNIVTRSIEIPRLKFYKIFPSILICTLQTIHCRLSVIFTEITAKEAIILQAWTGPEGSRRLRLYQNSRQSAHECGKFVSPTHRPPLLPRKNFWYSFLLEAEPSEGHSAAGRIMSMKNYNDTIENRTRDLPACSVSAHFFCIKQSTKI